MITIYTTPTCVWCQRVKAYLDQALISYTAIDVGDDPVQARIMVQLSGQMGVPVIAVNEDIIIGFDKDKLEHALRKHNYR